MPIVEYTGPETADLKPGQHLVFIAADNRAIVARTGSGAQVRITDRHARKVYHECLCPACDLDRGKVLSLD